MKSSQLKQIIKEEILNCNLQIIHESFDKTQKDLGRQFILRENIISDVMSLFLEPKYKRQADAVKNSPEYKQLSREIARTSDTINRLSIKLKKYIDAHQNNIESMKSAGIKVTQDMNGEQLFRAYKSWQTKLNKSAGIDTKINPDWEKYFK
jgi:hypothetical protein